MTTEDDGVTCRDEYMISTAPDLVGRTYAEIGMNDAPKDRLKIRCGHSDVNSFEITPESVLRVEGYSASEVDDLLAVYRKHMELMLTMASSGRDSVRYQPE